MEERKLKEECGVFAITTDPSESYHAASETYTALFALQHRGQETCGIAVNDRGVITVKKGVGLVNEVFDVDSLNALEGQAAIGHVRYSTAGSNDWLNAQPTVVRHQKGNLAVALNGQITNAFSLRSELERKGCIFQTDPASELATYLIVRARMTVGTIQEALCVAAKQLKGAFSIVVMSPRKVMAVRDGYGFRPLCIGRLGKGYVISSESCAIESVGGRLERDVAPGELIVIEDGKLTSMDTGLREKKTALCCFEYVYFARPDSVIDGLSVDRARRLMGAHLARLHPVEADIVIGVPDSGLSAAMGYAEESGIPYGVGLIKNRYIGRTFIQPTQVERERAVKIKLNAMAENIRGKRVVMIDDSIVRGTTGDRIVNILRDAGATEVHMRVASPPFTDPCYYGTDVPDRSMLIAPNHSVEEIAKKFGVDSLGYLTEEALADIAKECDLEFCTSCFNGRYPVEREQESSIYERRIGE